MAEQTIIPPGQGDWHVTAGKVECDGELDTKVSHIYQASDFLKAYAIYVECEGYPWRRMEFIKGGETIIMLED